jgi:ribosomal protein S18 acetylase RimI-like enzyme
LLNAKKDAFMIQIINPDKYLIKKASKLISEVFPAKGFSDRLILWAFKHQSNFLVKKIISLFGIYSLSNFSVAINKNNEVVGTIGICIHKKDGNEAIWLAWFCVDPKQRDKGIGKQLLEHSINVARGYNKKYFRLYTSSNTNRSIAQIIYENYGFKVTKKQKKLFYTKIYRELVL